MRTSRGARSAGIAHRRAPAARKSVTLALALLAVLAACGGGKKPGASSSPSPSVSGSQPPGSTASPGTSGQTSPRPGTGTTTGSTTTGTTSGGPRPSASSGESTAALDRSCARRGVDRQGLTGHTQPNGPYGYSTIYSNGDPYFGPSPGETAGNGGQPSSDSRGNFRETWVVPALAPVGDAVVKVTMAGVILDLPFKVVEQTGTCP